VHQAQDGLAIDVGDQVPGAQPGLLCGAPVLHALRDTGETGDRGVRASILASAHVLSCPASVSPPAELMKNKAPQPGP
jgi:hypothetical protein